MSSWSVKISAGSTPRMAHMRAASSGGEIFWAVTPSSHLSTILISIILQNGCAQPWDLIFFTIWPTSTRTTILLAMVRASPFFTKKIFEIGLDRKKKLLL